MALFKCKMCGGTIEFEPGATVGVCDSCGTKQTLPRLDDDRKANLYDRANHFRRNNDFDKAMSIYEQILNEDGTDAETYWSLVLCKYGIEYVDDPATRKRVPTVNRAQFTSVLADEDYKSALQYADGARKEIYETEARAIDEIQKGILEISQKEEPFDVFICYKETDANGRRTQDSVLATELYHELTKDGFKVFFSRITLEDKLGTAYEPYIFAALNSAKAMVVLGTKPEYFNAVWVKNEWSRYLALIKNGAKKTLIPAYRDMDPYDLPEEFSHLQAQDMSKLGFMQDLIRGIKKLIGSEAKPALTIKEAVVVNGGAANTAPLLKRAFLFLEDGNWQEADEYCEKVLDQDPENAGAYLGKLMAELHVRKQENLKDCDTSFENDNNYKKTLRFADPILAEELKGDITFINERNENERLNRFYDDAVSEMRNAKTEEANKAAAERFKTISGFKDADALAQQCMGKAAELEKVRLAKEEADRLEAERQAEIRRIAKAKTAKRMKRIVVVSAATIAAAFAVWAFALPGFFVMAAKNALANDDYGTAIQRYSNADRFGLLNDLFGEQEMVASGVYTEQAEDLRSINDYDGAVEAYKNAGNIQIISKIYFEKGEYLFKNGDYLSAVYAFQISVRYDKSNLTSKNEIQKCYYYAGMEAMKAENWEEAVTYFEKVGNYEDTVDQLANARTLYGNQLFECKKFLDAAEQFVNSTCPEKVAECHYCAANVYLEREDYKSAAEQFDLAEDYEDSEEQAKSAWYTYACTELADPNTESYDELYKIFYNLGDYLDSPTYATEAMYLYACEKQNEGDYKAAASNFEQLGKYQDSRDRWLASQYAYVIDHENRNDQSTYEFLKNLTSANYEDSKAIYKELYAWHAEMVAVNSDPDDYDTICDKANAYSYLHYQFDITGGYPGEKVVLTHTVVWPGGSVGYSNWDWGECTDGSQIGVQWEDAPYSSNARTGKLTINVIIKGTGEIIGSGSVVLTTE